MGETLQALSAAPFVPIEEAALGCIEVAPPGELTARDGGIAAEPAELLGDRSLRHLLAERVAVPAARVHVLADVLVHAGSWTVFKAGRPVLETVPSWRRGAFAEFLAQPHFAPFWAKCVTAEIEEPALCAMNAPNSNYAHWHMDCLAGIALGRVAAGPEPRLLLPRHARRFQEDSLARLPGSGEEGALRVGGLVRCRRLLWPSTLDPLPLATPQAASCFDAIRAAVLAGQPVESDERVYLARFDAAGRREIENEAALAKALAHEGFRIVTPGELDFAAQVRCAAGARVLIGAHGAGLTNAGYAQRGAMLVELHPAGYGGPAYARLAMLRGLAWRGWIMPTEGEGHAARAHVDIPALLTQLREWGAI